jgi:hypothetical protein
MVESLVKQLCEGKTISQAKLKEELSLVSPKIAIDLMVTRLKSKLEAFGEHEDQEKVKDHDAEVQKDVDNIRALWNKYHRRAESPSWKKSRLDSAVLGFLLGLHWITWT